MTNQLILLLSSLQLAMPWDLSSPLSLLTSEYHDSMWFISLIRFPLNVCAAKLKGSTDRSFRSPVRSLSDPRPLSDTHAHGGSADRDDLIKFADAESDDYSIGRKENDKKGKEDNENNCRG